VNFKDLLDSILQRIEFDIRELKVDLRIQTNLPTITCDRIKIGEVLLNLVNNAVKFSSKNNKEHPKVEIGYHDKKKAHEFYVKDNGIGIDPQYHQRIFGLFEHLHLADQFEGVGLGLNIVKRVIEDQGGKVWVESALGKGATFYFTIPRSLKT
jgi:light-regulated signal transduction histidine kinase (bacteriophytochrome)